MSLCLAVQHRMQADTITPHLSPFPALVILARASVDNNKGLLTIRVWTVELKMSFLGRSTSDPTRNNADYIEAGSRWTVSRDHCASGLEGSSYAPEPLNKCSGPPSARLVFLASSEHVVSTWRSSTERQHGVAGNYTHYCVCFQQFHRTQ